MTIDEIVQFVNDHGYTGGDNELCEVIQSYANSERADELNGLSSPTFTRTIHTTITDSNGGIYSDEEKSYISKYEVQERIAQLSNPQEEKR